MVEYAKEGSELFQILCGKHPGIIKGTIEYQRKALWMKLCWRNEMHVKEPTCYLLCNKKGEIKNIGWDLDVTRNLPW